MNGKRQDELLENLAVASAIAFLGLLLAGAFFLVDGGAESVERGIVTRLAGKAPRAEAIPVADPAFGRVFVLDTRGSPRFAMVATVGRAGRGERFAFLFGKDGSLEAWRPADEGSAIRRLPVDAILRAFLGKGGEEAFTLAAGMRLDREEYATAEAMIPVLERLSAAARDAAAAPKD